MPSKSRSTAVVWAVCATLAASVMLFAAPARAQDEKAAENEVVAKVAGEDIWESDVGFMAEDFVAELRRVPEEQRRGILVGALVDMKLMAQAAAKDGLSESEAFQRRLAFLRMRALRDAYVEAKVASALTDDEVKARYDKDIADFEAAEEIQARHILLESEDAAKDVIKELDGGADFAELAKEKSTGPSGPTGGDLGFFTKGRMVKEFEDAAFALEPGTYSKEPVKTQFGWHVIKVEERRRQEPPAFDQVKDRIKEALMREKYIEIVEALKKDADITIVGAEKPKTE